MHSREALISHKINARQAQNYAPLLTFSHFFIHNRAESIVDLASHYADIIRQFQAHSSTESQMDDAEKCLDKILQADILGENNERKSVMKLTQLRLDTENRDEIASIDTHLWRGGLALIHLDKKTIALAIHTNSDAIRYMLKNSSYASSYASILRRHENCIESNYRTQKTKVSGLKPTFILLDLQSIISQQTE